MFPAKNARLILQGNMMLQSISSIKSRLNGGNQPLSPLRKGFAIGHYVAYVITFFSL
ncbi:MAG: hypothetical protein HC815_09825 [Richelia sp. RM1_1_1]|nr:hypothetical protein [Richelia sp. RM1_1_1]